MLPFWAGFIGGVVGALLTVLVGVAWYGHKVRYQIARNRELNALQEQQFPEYNPDSQTAELDHTTPFHLRMED